MERLSSPLHICTAEQLTCQSCDATQHSQSRSSQCQECIASVVPGVHALAQPSLLGYITVPAFPLTSSVVRLHRLEI